MSYIDLVLIAVFIFFLVKGFYRGLFVEALGLAGYVAGFFVAANVGDPAGAFLVSKFGWPKSISSIVVTIGSFTVVAVLFMIVAHFITNALKKLKLSTPNRVFGGVFGVVEASVICGLVLAALIKNPISKSLAHTVKTKSVLAPYIMKAASKVFGYISL